MERDDVGLFARQSSHCTIAEGDIAMRGTMESVPPDAVPPVQVIWDGIQVGHLGKRMMKGSIEHRHLGNVFAEGFAGCLDAFDVVWIVNRGQIDAVLKSLQNRVVNQGRLCEHLTAMHHSVSYRIYVGCTLDFRCSWIRSDVANQVFEHSAHISQRLCERLPWLVAAPNANDCLSSYALNLAPADVVVFILSDPFNVCGNHLKFQGGASRV